MGIDIISRRLRSFSLFPPPPHPTTRRCSRAICFFKLFLFVLMTLIASIITFSKKKILEKKNITLDPRLGTLQPRPQGFSLKKFSNPTHFLREKPWGRGWVPSPSTWNPRPSTLDKKIDSCEHKIYFFVFCNTRPAFMLKYQ